jgi:hypothetical protein
MGTEGAGGDRFGIPAFRFAFECEFKFPYEPEEIGFE